MNACYIGGYAIAGQSPVLAFCPASADADAHAAQQDADEARGEHVNSCIDQAVDDMLAGPNAGSLLGDLSSANGLAVRAPLSAIYSKETGECSADTQDDWTRVMLYAEAEHLPMLRQQWRDWVRAQVAEYSEVIEAAEKLADREIEDAAELVAMDRADARGAL